MLPDAGGMVKYWHIETSTSLQTIREPIQLLTSSCSPTLTNFVAAGGSDQIYVYDLETGKKRNTCAPR